MTVILIALAAALAGQVGPSTPVARSLFEPIPPASVFSGCGCSFTTAGDSSTPEGPVVFSSNYEGVARIALPGGIIQLSATRPDVACRPSHVGGRCVLKYRGNDVRVLIKARATWVCPTDDESESCELVRLSGRMSGQAGGVEATVEVQGECGC